MLISAVSYLVKAIAIPREISFQYFEHGGDQLFRVRCTVDFYGPRKTDPSPMLLRLIAPGARGEIARMHTPDGIVPRCPCHLDYEGEGRWSQLAEAAKRTMAREPQGEGDYKPWDTVPPGGTIYCNLELHLPDGQDWKDHHESMVKFDFQLAKQHWKMITIRIDPWKSFQEHSPSITLL